jgi:hypothetical protein
MRTPARRIVFAVACHVPSLRVESFSEPEENEAGLWLHRVVVILGKDYERKEWPGLEWRAVRDLIREKSSERIVLVRVDDAPVAGVFGLDGYLDARRLSPELIADHILERLRTLKAGSTPASRAREPAASRGVTGDPSPGGALRVQVRDWFELNAARLARDIVCMREREEFRPGMRVLFDAPRLVRLYWQALGEEQRLDLVAEAVARVKSAEHRLMWQCAWSNWTTGFGARVRAAERVAAAWAGRDWQALEHALAALAAVLHPEPDREAPAPAPGEAAGCEDFSLGLASAALVQGEDQLARLIYCYSLAARRDRGGLPALLDAAAAAVDRLAGDPGEASRG